uniref:Direct IAP-binding protein with low pI n=1 Tax=Neogobius melanostomus TaxID=47308 RepID=A0A8C6THT4_9GOBI
RSRFLKYCTMQAVRCSLCAGRIAGALDCVFVFFKYIYARKMTTFLHFLQQVENLSHDSLIRRAASVVTDSSSTFLSQTTLALIDSLADYAKAVHTRIALQRQYLATLGKLSPAEDDSLWKLINNQRAEVTDRLSQCKHYETTWTFAMDISKMAVEAAYVSGAEQASITIRTNIQLAQSQIDEAKKGSAEADRKLAETKADEIQRMAEYHAFLQNNDHEMHEAYLRED